jgi:uncharacterized protein (DUF58 family)
VSGLRAALGGLTTRGRCLLAAGITLAVCAVVLGQRDLFRAAVFLVVLPLAAVGVVARTRYRLSCRRTLAPARVEAGRPAEVDLVLDNVSRLPSGVLLLEDTLPYSLGGRPRFVLDRVEPQGTRTVGYPVRSDARGRYPVGPLSVRLTDPFGLVELSRAFAAVDELVVHPVVERLPAVRLGGDWAGGGESSARSVAASGTEDISTREYRHGDDLRKVHWKSTARTGELMVRREEQPFQSRATLLLDGRAAAHRGDGPGSSFEWAVAAVASAGTALARAGFALHLLDHAGRDLSPAGVPLTEPVLLDVLAGVEHDRADSIVPAATRLRRAGVDGALVAVLGALDAEQAEALARLRTGSATCIAVLLHTDSWAPTSARGLQASLDRHAATHALLAATGWRVLPVSHGDTLASVWPLAGGRTSSAPGARRSAPPAPAPTPSAHATRTPA